MAAALRLVTGRLLLRGFEEGDFEAVHHYASDPEVTRYTHFGPNSEEETREFLRSAASPKEGSLKTYDFAIALKSEGRLIGGCSIRISADKEYEASIGYVLAREHWGQGFATEAASALLQFGFQQLGLQRIVATCHPSNTASWRVMEKNGMRREGSVRDERCQKKKWPDCLLYAITAPVRATSHAD